MAEKKWIQGAVHPEREGEFRAKAKAAGQTTAAYARAVLKRKGINKKLRGQAQFALNMTRLAHKK